MKKAEEIEKFKKQLDEHYSYPADYPFKFIIPKSQLDLLKSKLPPAKIIENPSRSGKYISISFTMEMQSSDDIIDIYLNVNEIKGIISL